MCHYNTLSQNRLFNACCIIRHSHIESRHTEFIDILISFCECDLKHLPSSLEEFGTVFVILGIVKTTRVGPHFRLTYKSRCSELTLRNACFFVRSEYSKQTFGSMTMFAFLCFHHFCLGCLPVARALLFYAVKESAL